MSSRVAVIHPDLGLGGAERLIVDASRALQDKGHVVEIYTAYHDETRCFDETRDGTLKVITVGQWIPPTIFGFFHALMAYIKIIYIAIYLIIFSNTYDLILCDQVSACIPIFKILPTKSKKSKIVFYCHFPDQLLTERRSLIKKIYRMPLDKFEEWSTGLADVIFVNSEFTSKVVKQTFNSLKHRQLIVLYPCVDVKKIDKSKPSSEVIYKYLENNEKFSKAEFIFLSFNRFERKKGLQVAIEHFHLLQQDYKHSNHIKQCHLILAGGYDERLKNCVRYYNELEEMISKYSLDKNVSLIKSPSELEKQILFEICDVVIYTPENEHFGIVPLEAMAFKKPVIAHASGGPLETVQHDITGFHYKHQLIVEMKKLYNKKELCKEMGLEGGKQVMKYDYTTFRNQLDRVCFPPD